MADSFDVFFFHLCRVSRRYSAYSVHLLRSCSLRRLFWTRLTELAAVWRRCCWGACRFTLLSICCCALRKLFWTYFSMVPVLGCPWSGDNESGYLWPIRLTSFVFFRLCRVSRRYSAYSVHLLQSCSLRRLFWTRLTELAAVWRRCCWGACRFTLLSFSSLRF